MTGLSGIPRSTVEGAVFPAIPPAVGATLLAMQFQFEQSQWWPPERLRAAQFLQFGQLLAHALASVPYYREVLGPPGLDPEAMDEQAFSRIPLLTRDTVQERRAELVSASLPASHGRITEYRTSGATGKPLHGYGSELTAFLWSAFTLRDHLWHRRDLSGKLAAIRAKTGRATLPGWGPATDAAFQTGPSAALPIATGIDGQLDWLVEEAPDYLITHPSNARALLLRARQQGLRVPRLKEIRSFGESLPEDLRQLAREIWEVRITDTYSCEELGYLALQCPAHEHYHVQAEGVLLEVLDESGRPCREGEVGRVVLTSLHNFAMPLIRYENGDYAEVGGPCPCGRGLPVLRRIMGRVRNMVVLPDGRRHWPSFPADAWGHLTVIRQIQLVQHTPDAIEARLVTDRELADAEKAEFTAILQRCLRYPFSIAVNRVPEIPPSPNHKYEDFVSMICV